MIKGEKQWILIQYEKLPRVLYFQCGCVIHMATPCLQQEGQSRNTSQYGSWLRAPQQAKFEP